ncbi:MAG TPA: hypothetical protein VH475_23820 [Tepidisphaeraceae bacterium]
MFDNAYWLRDAANKAVRRAKKLVGRPDNAPWILRPPGGTRGANAYVDFIVALDFIGNNAVLTRMFHQALSPYGLSLLIANKHNVRRLTEDLRHGRIKPHVLLDLCSACEREFGELLRVAAAAGIYTIGQPEKLERWTYKARAQQHLEDAGLPVPPTVVIRADQPSRELTLEERRAVGEACVIKPSWGVAGKGVMVNVRPTRENIDAARQFDPKDDYLVQRMIKWEKLGSRSAYVRGYNVLGHRTLLWWAPETKQYDLLTWEELQTYDLMGAIDLIDRMARLTGMDYFSSEIAITSGAGGQSRFVLIDYCNDQCDLNPITAQPDGLPEPWVRWACERFAEFVWRKRQGVEPAPGHTVWLANGTAAPAGDSSNVRMVTAA